jgi:hypothetical protein
MLKELREFKVSAMSTQKDDAKTDSKLKDNLKQLRAAEKRIKILEAITA